MLSDGDVKALIQSDMTKDLVGKNYEFYEKKWAKIIEKAGSDEKKMSTTYTMNWPAILFLVPWAMYRRMYSLAAIAVIGSLGIVVVEILSGFDASIATFVIFIFLGAMANSQYLIKTLRTAKEISATNDPALRSAKLVRESGPSPLLAVVGVAIVIGQMLLAGLLLSEY